MASPFTGMDPYIEGCGFWEDFHSKRIGEIERALSARVPDRYVVRTGNARMLRSPSTTMWSSKRSCLM